ncbi:MAG TPA: FeoA family protein [Polyangiaceae bacterium]|nr:FeoA family protein [Polyangiaceae bacterium]
MTLNELPVGASAVILRVGGQQSFRRRLLELGLLPGTEVQLLRVAPLGDPLELWARDCNLSIRKQEAELLHIEPRTGARAQ